jgi:hypothetical protein
MEIMKSRSLSSVKSVLLLSNARHIAFAILGCLSVLIAGTANATFVELGTAGAYTVLSTSIDNKGADFGIGSGATTITGDVALGPNSSGTVEKATINGNLFVDSTSTTSIHSDVVVTGSTFLNQNLSGAVADAFAASNFFKSLAPTQTFADITGDFTITGTAGRNVISLNSVNEQGTLTINGSSTSQFVFNITAGFILNGGSIVLAGGVTPDNVLFNFNGAGDGITLNKPVGDAMGIFLAPQRDIILDKATLIGAIIGGGDGNKLVVHSGATLITAVPEVTPSSVIFGFLGLVVAVSSRRVLMGRALALAAARKARG